MSLTSWLLPETIRLLELFTKNDLWDNRAVELEKEFGMNHPPGFFTVQGSPNDGFLNKKFRNLGSVEACCKRELHRVFSQPNPEHVNGLPTHPRSKEAAEMWLVYYRNQHSEDQENAKQMFLVTMRSILSLIEKFKSGKANREQLEALRDQYRAADEQRPNGEQYENRLKSFMKRIHIEDLHNVNTTEDLLEFIRGERVQFRERQPSPAKYGILSPKSIIMSPKSPPSSHYSSASEKLSTPVSPSRSVETTITTASSTSEHGSRRSSRRGESVASVSATHVITHPQISVLPAVKSPPQPQQQPPVTASVAVLSSSPSKNLRKRPASLLDHEALPEVRRGRRSEAAVAAFASSTESAAFSSSTLECDMKPGVVEAPPAKRTRASEKSILEASAAITSASSSASSDKALMAGVNPASRKLRSAHSKLPSSTHVVAEESNVASPLVAAVVTAKTQKIETAPIRKTRASESKTTVAVTSESKPSVDLLNETALTVRVESLPSPIVAALTQSPPSAVAPAPTPAPTRSVTPSVTKPEKKSAQLPARNLRSAQAKTDPNRHKVVGKAPLLALWKEICTFRYADIFLCPVNEAEVPGYRSAVKCPVDLCTIKRLIENGTVETFDQMSNLLCLMYANAVMFNSTGHDVNFAAKDMYQRTFRAIQRAIGQRLADTTTTPTAVVATQPTTSASGHPSVRRSGSP